MLRTEMDWFGEWICNPVVCRGIRLVIEQISEGAEQAGVANLEVRAAPKSSALLVVSSGEAGLPWRADSNDGQPSIGFLFNTPTTVQSFRFKEISETHWVRRARIEICRDEPERWEVFVPSRLIDAYHRQPCVFDMEVETLESRLLPAGRGTAWIRQYYRDFFLRTLEFCGPGSRYPDGLTSRYFIGAAAWPTFFNGGFNAGDCGTFNALTGAILQPAFTIESQKLFPDMIKRFGFMPGTMDPGKTSEAFAADFSNIIWGPSCYWDIWSWTGDRDYLGWFTHAAAKWSRWWLANRDRNNDGWLEPGVNSCRETSMEERTRLLCEGGERSDLEWYREAVRYVGTHRATPALLLSIFESPWDDGPVYVRGRYRGIRFDPMTCSVNIHFIETQLYNAGLADFCARAFEELGDRQQASEFRQQARRLEELVRLNCWDEKTGFYYDRDIDTSRLRTEIKHAGGFYPMIHGLPTMVQARRMVAHLLNPSEFWTAYPVPTISKDSPEYNPTSYWSGRAWPPVNFHILRGLICYGFFEAADRLLDRWLEVIRGCFDRPQDGWFEYGCEESVQIKKDMRRAHIPDCEVVSPENWNPENGEVQGTPGLTWGGLWIPAVIYRNFWPDGAHHVLVRPGGYLRFCQKGRWDVLVNDRWATVNGRSFRMKEDTTYRMDCHTGRVEPLELPLRGVS